MLLGLVLIFNVAGQAVIEKPTLPKVGDQTNGFVVVSVTPITSLDATGVLFEHIKTGMQFLYLSTEDTNRSFDITFRTPALDDTGKPHVFEHMTISGSQKYPDANMIFPLVNQTYSTYINAVTYHGMTSYPVASLSEDQLMTLADYYLSGVFEPLVYTEPRLVKREAWRYELFDADEPLTIAGTVYSEVQGAQTVSRQAQFNSISTIFKDGLTAHVSGGTPEAISTLTPKELTDFHDAYYHPSNALVILYGKLDYARFLKHMDEEYLSNYEKSEILVEKGTVKPYTETLHATYDAPVERGTQTENASYIFYCFGADGAQLEDLCRLSLLTKILSQDSSLLMRKMREVLPNANISIDINEDLPVPVISVIASGVNESDKDLFVKTVDDCLAQIGEEGFAKSDLDATLASLKMDFLLMTEDPNLGVNASLWLALEWTHFDRLDFFNVYGNTINEMNTEEMLNTLNRWMLHNTYRAVSVTRPIAGLAEENAKRLSEKMALIKASMTKEEIDALVTESQEFLNWSTAPVSSELIGKILNVTPKTLPEELVHYDITDETVDGIRYVTSEAKVDGVANVQLLFDGSTIPIQQLQDVNLYLDLLGQIGTGRHSKEEVNRLTLRYMNEFTTTLKAMNTYEESGTPLYSAKLSYKVLREDVGASVSLLEEMLLHTDLSDTDTIRKILNRKISSFAQNLDSNVINIQRKRMLATFDLAFAYSTYVTDFDYYYYMMDTLALSDETLTARLEAARNLVLNRYHAVVNCAGDAPTIATVRKEMASLLAKFPNGERQTVDYSTLLKNIAREAVTVNSTVQMNLIFSNADSYSGKDTVIESLINDMYLMPQLRNALGAYGAFSIMSPFYQGLYTYRDPNLASTFKAFEALPEYLRTAEITQNMVDTYIVGSYIALSRPQRGLNGATTAINNYLQGLSEETRLRWMKEAKQTTVKDVRDAADRIQWVVDHGMRSTSATASVIEKNKELFDSVVRLDTGEQAR